MLYEATLKVEKNEAARIDRALGWKEGCPEADRFGEDDSIIYTVGFPNGYQADLKVAGTAYEELDEEEAAMFPGHNAAWTEMALFTPAGSEAAVSEPGEEFFGEWYLDHDGDTYRVAVQV